MAQDSLTSAGMDSYVGSDRMLQPCFGRQTCRLRCEPVTERNVAFAIRLPSASLMDLSAGIVEKIVVPKNSAKLDRDAGIPSTPPYSAAWIRECLLALAVFSSGMRLRGRLSTGANSLEEEADLPVGWSLTLSSHVDGRCRRLYRFVVKQMRLSHWILRVVFVNTDFRVVYFS